VLAVIRTNFERQVKKGTVTAEQRDAALARIRTSMSLDAVADAELVIEAATEQPEVKFRIFSDLDRLHHPPPSSQAIRRPSRSPRSPPAPSALPR